MSTNSLIVLWWERLPTLGGRLSRMLGIALGEGVYLTAWRPFAALAPAGALLVGVLAGWHRLGGEQVFTESAYVIALAIAFGLVAAQLGALFATGYALGDFLLWRHPDLRPSDLLESIQLLGGLLVLYVALAILAAGVPLAVRTIRAQTPLPSDPAAADARVALDAVLGAGLAGAFTFLYLQALPILVRPFFTWQGRPPSTESVVPVQEQAWVFVLVAVVIGGVRVLVEYGAGIIDPAEVQRRAAALDAVEPSLWDRVPAVLRVAVSAIVGTFLLGGFVGDLVEAVILFGGLLMINVLRTMVAPRIPAWPQALERIPAILRLPLALGLAYFVATWVAGDRLVGTSFIPLIWGSLAGLLCVALLFPATAESPPGPAQTQDPRAVT